MPLVVLVRLLGDTGRGLVGAMQLAVTITATHRVDWLRLVVRRGRRYRTAGAGIQQTPGYRSGVLGGLLDRILGRVLGMSRDLGRILGRLVGRLTGGVLGWVGSMERCGEGC